MGQKTMFQEKHILIIDDDAFLKQLLSLALSHEGYAVRMACQGKEAMKILSEQAIDIIVMDLMMPEMDGLNFLQWLRQDVKLDIPALVLTGMTVQSIEQKAMQAGATALLYKPVKMPDLVQKIKVLAN